MMKCKHQVVNQWYHMREFPGTTHHPCCFNAVKDGFCFRHHPLARKTVLLRRIARFKLDLRKAEAELKTIKNPELAARG